MSNSHDDEPEPKFPQVTDVHHPTPDEAKQGIVGHFVQSGDGWTAVGTVARGPQGLSIIRLEVIPGKVGDDVGPSVTSRMLRDIPVGALLDRVRQWAAMNEALASVSGEGVLMGFERPSRTADEIIAAGAPTEPRPGRAALPDELMRAVAEGYIAESAPGMPRGAVKRLAEALDRPEQTVSRWVARARKEGWLGPGAAGREGAEPGPRLVAHIAAERASAEQ
ncbi:helix-turn-helix domain-containing protein [Streptomyces deccanensis]|uniref:helix-turn-helix domain-containing protein n=1 Tax=Streptomyces deccanensis TaxID=424188 RepID=UPI001EFC0321|nr:helix-turn-helix domain-containing protein [Streptomyces deccanensis]ULR50601.1 helix-turn-helix domain-containing protein [Streptomyces deccanensis]